MKYYDLNLYFNNIKPIEIRVDQDELKNIKYGFRMDVYTTLINILEDRGIINVNWENYNYSIVEFWDEDK